jgi:hypothetical protein
MDLNQHSDTINLKIHQVSDHGRLMTNLTTLKSSKKYIDEKISMSKNCSLIKK